MKMKGIFLFVVLSAFLILCTLPVTAGRMIVIEDFEDFPFPPLPPSWGPPPISWDCWTIVPGAGEDGSTGAVFNLGSWCQKVYLTGVPAPINVGDYVSAEMRFEITTSSTAMAGANKYAWNLGFETETDGTGAGAEYIFSRRAQTIIGGATTGDDQAWDLHGWSNISTIGMNDGLGDTSDWFGQRVTVTKTAVGYDVLSEVLDNSDGVIFSHTNLAQTLPTMAAASTWYFTIRTQDPASCEIVSVAVDNMILESVWGCDAVIDAGQTLAADISGPAGIPDCYVNMFDFDELSETWLATADMDDLVALAALWLGCNNPEDAGCTY